MKKRTVVILIIVGVLVLIGLAYYFLIFKKSGEREEDEEGGGGAGGGDTQPYQTSLSVKDNVFLRTDKAGWAGDNGIPVYRNTVADSAGSFLAGVTRGDWYPGQSIGKVKEIKFANGENWTKVGVNNLQVWKFIVNTGYTQQIEKLTGDFWFRDNALYKL